MRFATPRSKIHYFYIKSEHDPVQMKAVPNLVCSMHLGRRIMYFGKDLDGVLCRIKAGYFIREMEQCAG